MAKRKAEGGGRRRLLRLGRFRMQIAKAYNQSAGGTIHIQAVSVGKHERRQTGDHGLLRVAGCICTCTQRIHAYVHLGGSSVCRGGPRRGEGVEQRLEVGWDGMVYTRTQRNLVGGSMADIRGVYGRQAEAHQFPIQFVALALPILGDSRERERGSFLPPERWRFLLAGGGSMNRFHD